MPTCLTQSAHHHRAWFRTGSLLNQNRTVYMCSVIDSLIALKHSQHDQNAIYDRCNMHSIYVVSHAACLHCSSVLQAQQMRITCRLQCGMQSGKGHHIVKSRSRVNDALLTSRGIVAAYPKAAKMTHLMTHARHYLPHDTLLIRYEKLHAAHLHPNSHAVAVLYYCQYCHDM